MALTLFSILVMIPTMAEWNGNFVVGDNTFNCGIHHSQLTIHH
jgi:hypothetical protein